MASEENKMIGQATEPTKTKHVRDYTEEEMKELLQELGLTEQEIEEGKKESPTEWYTQEMWFNWAM